MLTESKIDRWLKLNRTKSIPTLEQSILIRRFSKIDEENNVFSMIQIIFEEFNKTSEALKDLAEKSITEFYSNGLLADKEFQIKKIKHDNLFNIYLKKYLWYMELFSSFVYIDKIDDDEKKKFYNNLLKETNALDFDFLEGILINIYRDKYYGELVSSFNDLVSSAEPFIKF